MMETRPRAAPRDRWQLTGRVRAVPFGSGKIEGRARRSRRSVKTSELISQAVPSSRPRGDAETHAKVRIPIRTSVEVGTPVWSHDESSLRRPTRQAPLSPRASLAIGPSIQLGLDGNTRAQSTSSKERRSMRPRSGSCFARRSPEQCRQETCKEKAKKK